MRRAAWCLALFVTSTLLLILTHVDARSSFLLVFFITLQAWAGGYAWRALMPKSLSLVETVGAGLALGSAAAALAAALAGWLPLNPELRPWAWLAIPALAVILWFIRRARGMNLRPLKPTSFGVQLGIGVGLLLGLVTWFVNVRNYPLTWLGDVTTYHPDMLFFQAISTSTVSFGAHDSILMAGADLRYHWFVYGWAGQLTASADALPFVVLTRLLPIVAIVSLVLLASAWAGRLSRIRWVPAMAAILVVAGGYVGASYGTILNADSPSQALSMTWLVALSMSFLAYLRHPKAWGLAAVTIALVAACAGGKISAAVVAVAGMGLVLIVSVIRREAWWRPALLVFAGSVVGLVVVYLLFLNGSAEQGGLRVFNLVDKASTVQGLNPLNSTLGIIAGTVILLLAIVARWAGLAWLIASPRSRYSPSTVYGTGLAAIGFLTILLVSGGLNDTWFALASSVPLAVLSAVGVGRAISTIQGRRVLVPLVTAATIMTIVVVALWASDITMFSLRWVGPVVALLGSIGIALIASRSPKLIGGFGVRVFAITLTLLVLLACAGRLPGIASNNIAVSGGSGGGTAGLSPFLAFVESQDQELIMAINSDQVRAGSFLNEHASSMDLVATNVTFSPIVSSLSSLRTYVSGIKYQAPYGLPESIPVLLQRERESLDFITSPSTITLAPLCSAGVDWLWVDPRRVTSGAITDFASTEFSSESAVILRLLPGSCGN